MENNTKKEVAKLYDELETLRLNLGSPLVSDLLKDKLKPQEESLKTKIIEAAGQLRLF
ncbi:MAG: hypothetical protein ACI8PB_005300 [Desulforhopalus sp.]|jgi:hypothetical protein